MQIAGLNEAEGGGARNRLVDTSLLRMLDRDRQRFQLHGLLREELRNLALTGGAVDQPRTERSRILLDLTDPRTCDLVLLFEVRHHGLEFDVRHERGHRGIITHQRQDAEDIGKYDA